MIIAIIIISIVVLINIIFLYCALKINSEISREEESKQD